MPTKFRTLIAPPQQARLPATTLTLEPTLTNMRKDMLLPTAAVFSTVKRLPDVRENALTDSDEPMAHASNRDTRPARANVRTDSAEPMEA